nr:hypothetical protein [Tanacetum cinerariifolium]
TAKHQLLPPDRGIARIWAAGRRPPHWPGAIPGTADGAANPALAGEGGLRLHQQRPGQQPPGLPGPGLRPAGVGGAGGRLRGRYYRHGPRAARPAPDRVPARQSESVRLWAGQRAWCARPAAATPMRCWARAAGCAPGCGPRPGAAPAPCPYWPRPMAPTSTTCSTRWAAAAPPASLSWPREGCGCG